MDPVCSKNTGEYHAVISQTREPAGLSGREVSVVSMVTPLLSLINPILPPDYGFAVVEFGQGAVPLDARSDLWATAATMFTLLTGRYVHGAGTSNELLGRAMTGSAPPLSSLQQSPWSLIVFHNLSDRGTEHFERMVLFAALTLSYYVLLAVALLAFPVARRPPNWMWPQAACRGRYLHLALTNAVLALPFYVLVFDVSRPGSVLALAYLIPVVALAACILKLRSAGRGVTMLGLAALIVCFAVIAGEEPQSVRHLTALFVVIVCALSLCGYASHAVVRARNAMLETSYTLVWRPSLVVIAILPCAAFFRVSTLTATRLRAAVGKPWHRWRSARAAKRPIEHRVDRIAVERSERRRCCSAGLARHFRAKQGSLNRPVALKYCREVSPGRMTSNASARKRRMRRAWTIPT